ncbi:YabP/YqfC family sporulation protein [Oceanobacillus caeni]|uniref:YabP/YqfC family sporulation protein n=1 Tax=Oceanobacillus caeni TaxID=405946 RepID=UPI00195BD885
MKKFRQRVQSLLINSFALPSDVILELPRITVIGQIHVYIENHQGLVTYSDTELKLNFYPINFVVAIGGGNETGTGDFF